MSFVIKRPTAILGRGANGSPGRLEHIADLNTTVRARGDFLVIADIRGPSERAVATAASGVWMETLVCAVLESPGEDEMATAYCKVIVKIAVAKRPQANVPAEDYLCTAAASVDRNVYDSLRCVLAAFVRAEQATDGTTYVCSVRIDI